MSQAGRVGGDQLAHNSRKLNSKFLHFFLGNVLCPSYRTTSRLHLGPVVYLQRDTAPAVIEQLDKVRQRLKLSTLHISYVGINMLGPAAEIIKLGHNMVFVAKDLLQHELYLAQTGIRGWARVNTLAYASNLVINAMAQPRRLVLGALDASCTASGRVGSAVLSLRAIHTDAVFSKHDFFIGRYSHIKLKDLPTDMPQVMRDRCVWVALHAAKTFGFVEGALAAAKASWLTEVELLHPPAAQAELINSWLQSIKVSSKG